VNLKKSKLVGANLYRTNVSFVDLYGADLSDANLTLADLTRAIVWRSNVTGTDFTDTNLSEVKFSEEQIASNEMLRMRKKEDENRIAEEKRKEEEKELLAEAKRKQEQAKRVLEENREKEERERLAKELAAQLTEMIKDSGSVSQPTDGSESDTPKLLDQGTSGNISSAPSQTESASASVASNSPINQDAVGYKDLKVGMTLEEIKELNVCPRITERPYKLESGTCYQDFRAFLVGYCYGKNWEFTFRFDKAFKGNSRTCIAEPDFVVEQIEIDLGQFVEEKHDQFRDLLNKKYQSDYKFTDIDVERYNNQETTGLYDLYSRGKVALVIARTKAYVLFPNDLSRHFSIIQYNSDLRARKLIESVIPEKLDASDF